MAYHAALVAERAEVALLEGRSMREDIQSKAKGPRSDPKILRSLRFKLCLQQAHS